MITCEPLVWASFVPTIYPDNDLTQRPYTDLYCELVISLISYSQTDHESLKSACQTLLQEFNSLYASQRMDLVLFTNAIEHIIRIVRVLQTPLGHALLIGVGGQGRKYPFN